MRNKYEKATECGYLNKLFDSVRIVDPINNIVIDNKSKSNRNKEKCYSIWNENESCINCISLRALNENDTFIKIEYNRERIFLVMATPVVEEGNNYVLETLRDITDCKIIENVETKSSGELEDEIKRMNMLVVTDELTHCYNRRYINEKLPLDIKKSKETMSDLSLVVMDLDYFKEVNDTYTHLAGDYILKEVVKIITSNIRERYDWIARYGGEEFIIVFNNTSKESALELTNRIREIIKNNVFFYENNNINVTASFGIASLNDEIDDCKKLIKAADENLYKAKEQGRDLVIG